MENILSRENITKEREDELYNLLCNEDGCPVSHWWRDDLTDAEEQRVSELEKTMHSGYTQLLSEVRSNVEKEHMTIAAKLETAKQKVSEQQSKKQTQTRGIEHGR